ncbi:site-specific integrase [Aliagarivorans taiwanensis]|uniref:site-specific integrase n=1 Tax=Aliagarivorans taiwanensis TaxID=561966 RepID=UPI0003F59092|nr:site-specific integrase [Aliagarivorans taiwanensis]
MPSFRKQISNSAKHASGMMKQVQGSLIQSVGTVRNYEQQVKQCAEYLKENQLGTLHQLTVEQANGYLRERAETASQSSVDMTRQALEVIMREVTHQLPQGQHLDVVKSERQSVLSSRAYSSPQVHAIIERQTPPHALATAIAYDAGLRAHELHTLAPVDVRPPDVRVSAADKFAGRGGVAYSVVGKGGLCREVRISEPLAKQLEASRHPTPQPVTDRGIRYQSMYNIGGGQKWSNSFSAASSRALGWSYGAHGVRHAFAQERMQTLQFNELLPREEALRVVSQEMGHFRPDITEVYLR